MTKMLMSAVVAMATGALGLNPGVVSAEAVKAACCCGEVCNCEECGCCESCKDGECTDCENCTCEGCDCCDKE
jgi:hypothetical protein